MNPNHRRDMLWRYEAADRWLSRVYDPTRSEEHRAALWNFLMKHTDPRLKTILICTRDMDEQLINHMCVCGKN